ncbi:MAG TPA: GMC family oxidoreductase N-terminal domain-containing protein [Streptosporangiaceae bacterium]|nr:GMC family oxidoreductase N-terminal domain-containing protein [Streptosporangiaceae bacterium]
MYDYIIAGAGSAGCVLAARLTEDPDVRVLVVEAGLPDTDPMLHASSVWPTLWLSRYDWAYFSEPEPALHDRKVFLPRGKVVGGSSSINAMIYIRGNKLDYDGWAAAGATGWSYADVLPYFIKAEDNERGANEFHGAGGPLGVCDPHYRHPVMRGMLDAALQAGHSFNDDLNGAEQEGFGVYQSTQRNGMRCSAADAYLHPALHRPNLELLTGALVHHLVLDGTAVRGLALDVGGELREIRAEREVILSAGSYNTPQILMLSGIGRPDDLAPFGIPSVVDLPVGENLQDHILVQLAYLSVEESLIAANTPENQELLEKEHRGMLSSNGAEMGGFMRSSPDLEAPDIQLQGVPVLITQHGLGVPYDHGYSVGPTLLTPTSRGKVSLRTPMPGTAPRILHNHFSTEEDRQAMLRGLRMVLDIMEQPAMLEHRRGEPVNVPASDSDADLMAWLEREVFSVFHPVGTCAIGAVVDPELRVYGVDNLRVVDASVMPNVVRGNTNAPTIMIAEKAADIIRGRTPA